MPQITVDLRGTGLRPWKEAVELQRQDFDAAEHVGKFHVGLGGAHLYLQRATALRSCSSGRIK